MNVELMSYTPDALNLLLRTKGTRMKHDDDPAKWSEERKREHLDYMRHTIKSSWEFVDYTFRISGVTRAFTHQLVRHRHGSYAQESMRSVDVRSNAVMKPPGIAESAGADALWDATVSSIMGSYATLIDNGAAAQDARGLLPTNVTTSIIAKFSLRSLHEMALLRLCTRTQGEMQDVFREMRLRVIKVHDWAEEFLDVYCAVYGSCAFPAYGAKECPIFPITAHAIAMTAAQNVHNVFWTKGTVRYEATPKVSEGKAQ